MKENRLRIRRNWFHLSSVHFILPFPSWLLLLFLLLSCYNSFLFLSSGSSLWYISFICLFFLHFPFSLILFSSVFTLYLLCLFSVSFSTSVCNLYFLRFLSLIPVSFLIIFLQCSFSLLFLLCFIFSLFLQGLGGVGRPPVNIFSSVRGSACKNFHYLSKDVWTFSMLAYLTSSCLFWSIAKPQHWLILQQW